MVEKEKKYYKQNIAKKNIFKRIEFQLIISELLGSCIDQMCKVMEFSRDFLLNYFIIRQTELVYICPQVFVDIANNKKSFLMDSVRELDLFYNRLKEKIEGDLAK